jgi:hypothetical protein
MKELFLSIAALLFFIQHINAQHSLRRYEFPEFGISIPFFANADSSMKDKGKIDECIQYSYQSQKAIGHSGKYEKIIGSLKLFPNPGCMRADSFYNMVDRYALEYNDTKFRYLLSKAHTFYLGWSFFDITATVDKHPDNIVRKVQAFFNGEQLLIADVIFVNEDFNGIGKEIFDEPGYSSILRPLELPQLGLKLKVRGNVMAVYEKDEQKYFVGRCDKVGTLYPQIIFEYLDADPASAAISELGKERNRLGFENVKMETVTAKDKYAKFETDIHKIIADETGEMKGRAMLYLFKYAGKNYKVSAIVPYGPDDNRLFFESDRQISIETAKEMDIRILELLSNLEKI